LAVLRQRQIEFDQKLDEASEEYRQLEKERKQTEAELARHNLGKKIRYCARTSVRQYSIFLQLLKWTSNPPSANSPVSSRSTHRRLLPRTRQNLHTALKNGAAERRHPSTDRASHSQRYLTRLKMSIETYTNDSRTARDSDRSSALQTPRAQCHSAAAERRAGQIRRRERLAE